MTGRPPLALGTHGKIAIYPRGSGFEAHASIRDYDGTTRRIRRMGRSRSAAQQALLLAIMDRTVGKADLGPESRLRELAEQWFADEVERSAKSPGTKRSYRDRLDNDILPALGDVRLREVTPGMVDRHIRSVELRSPAVAKLIKSVLSNMFTYALARDVMERNPALGVGRVRIPVKNDPDAFTLAEAQTFLAKLRTDEGATKSDVVDLMLFMSGTSLRLSEAIAIKWDAVDLDGGTVAVGRGIVQRVNGEGLTIRQETSRKLNERTLELPDWLVLTLRVRREQNTNELVFPNTVGRLRDPSATGKAITAAFKATGFKGTSHKLRKTVASVLHEAGLAPVVGASQLGQKSLQVHLDRYVGRSTSVTGAKAVLELLMPEEPAHAGAS